MILSLLSIMYSAPHPVLMETLAANTHTHTPLRVWKNECSVGLKISLSVITQPLNESPSQKHFNIRVIKADSEC